MIVFMLTLAFPRETAGATFFYQHDTNVNYTLNCSQPPATKSDEGYVWCRGKGTSTPSLLQFEPVGRDQNKISARSFSGYTNKTQYGGIFACTPWTKNHPACPHFTNKTHCSSFDFFIVAVRNQTEEEKAFGKNHSEPSEHRAIAEKDTFNLTCELQILDVATEVTLYWFKEAAPGVCLFSASNEGNGDRRNFSYDFNCCVDAAVKERRTNGSISFDKGLLHHDLTVVNASSSDSGTYFCVVAVWARKRVWTMAHNVSVSVEVKNSTASHESPDGGTETRGETPADKGPSDGLQISLGVIGGVLLVGGIIGLLYWKKKAKGNPVERRPRNQTEMEMEVDDCSPYAVSSRKDVDRIETMYSVLTYPPETKQDMSTLSDGKAVSQSREKLHTVYALLSK